MGKSVEMTKIQALEVVEVQEQFELLDTAEVQAVVDILVAEKAEEKVMKRLARLIAERKEVAPKEEISTLVEMENSIKVPTKKKKPTPIKVNKEAKQVAEQKAETVQAELSLDVEQDDEKAMHIQLAEQINWCKNLKELRELASGYSVKIPSMKLEKAKQFVIDQTIGYDVLGEKEPDRELEVVKAFVKEVEAEQEKKVKKKPTVKKPKKVEKVETPVEEVEEEVVFEFPEVDQRGRKKISFENLEAQTVATPYEVYAYIQEEGELLTGCLVSYANPNLVVLIDKTVEVDSVIALATTSFKEEGTVVKFNDLDCKIAFYAPVK